MDPSLFKIRNGRKEKLTQYLDALPNLSEKDTERAEKSKLTAELRGRSDMPDTLYINITTPENIFICSFPIPDFYKYLV